MKKRSVVAVDGKTIRGGTNKKHSDYHVVSAFVTEKDETQEFMRYFITSLKDADEFAYVVRKHWSIENQLHWCFGVFSERTHRVSVKAIHW